MKIPNSKLINILLTVATVGLLFFEVHLLTQAVGPGDAAAETPADASETPAAISSGKPDQCLARMDDFLKKRISEFGMFINSHFRSDKPTSVLIDIAIERYRQYRMEVAEELNSFTPEKGKAIGTPQAISDACKKLVADHTQIVENELRDHIVKNAYAKKSTRLLDRYKAINDQLSKLNFTIAQTYGYFGTLAQKLPCYATECVKN